MHLSLSRHAATIYLCAALLCCATLTSAVVYARRSFSSCSDQDTVPDHLTANTTTFIDLYNATTFVDMLNIAFGCVAHIAIFCALIVCARSCERGQPDDGELPRALVRRLRVANRKFPPRTDYLSRSVLFCSGLFYKRIALFCTRAARVRRSSAERRYVRSCSAELRRSARTRAKLADDLRIHRLALVELVHAVAAAGANIYSDVVTSIFVLGAYARRKVIADSTCATIYADVAYSILATAAHARRTVYFAILELQLRLGFNFARSHLLSLVDGAAELRADFAAKRAAIAAKRRADVAEAKRAEQHARIDRVARAKRKALADRAARTARAECVSRAKNNCWVSVRVPNTSTATTIVIIMALSAATSPGGYILAFVNTSTSLALAIAAFQRLSAGGCIEKHPGMACWLVTGGVHTGTIVTTSYDDVKPLVCGVPGGASRRCKDVEEATRLRAALSLPPCTVDATVGRRARSDTPPPSSNTAAPTPLTPTPSAQRYWAVFHGRKRGVFLTWTDGALLAVSGFSNAIHERFTSLAPALQFACVHVVYDTFVSEGRAVDVTAPPAATIAPSSSPSATQPAPPAATSLNLVSDLDLAASDFNNLIREGIEANPGMPATNIDAAATELRSPARTRNNPGRAAALKKSAVLLPDQMRYHDLEARTNGQRIQHVNTYKWAATNLPQMKKNDIFYLSWFDESKHADDLPSPTRHYSVALVEKAEQTITVRFGEGREKLIIDQWRCIATELGESAGNNKRDIIFPMDKKYKESEETLCYMAASKSTYSTTSGNIVWKRVDTPPNSRPNFDRDQCTVLRRAPPGTDRDVFCDRVARIITCFAAAKARGDMDGMANIWHLFLSTPKMTLRCLKGDAPSRLRSRYIQQQLASPEAVLEQISVVRRGRVNEDGDGGEARPNDAEAAVEEKRKKKLGAAKRHAMNGFASKAAASLQQDELAQQSHETKLKNLKDLHPQGIAADQPIFPPAPTDKLPINISNADLLALIKSSISGAAPGSTGWTEEMLYDVCVYSESALSNIKVMLTSIVNNDTPECVRTRLLTGELLGIPKPDGGTRPIALTELMLKMASKLAINAELKALKNRFKETQFGVCAERGADTVIFATRDFIRHARSAAPSAGDGAVDSNGDSTKCVVTIDFKNAFNCPSRRMMVDAIQPFKYLMSMFRFEYATPSKLFVRGDPNGAFVMSSCGTRQGSTLGPVFFCLAIQNMLDDLNRMTGIRAMAYMDDLTIHAQSFDLANDAYLRLLEHASSLNLAVNVKKCELMSHARPSNIPATVCAGFERVKVAKLLGASIGLNDDLEKEHLEKRYNGKFAEWFSTLIGGYGSWASTILGVCGVPKLSYLVRNHHPFVTSGVAKAFDKQVETVWSTWADCRTDDITQTFAHLPIKLGGLGFTRQEQVAAACYSNARLQYEGAICAGAKSDAVQNLATMEVNLQLAAKIDAHSPGAARHRQVCMQAGTAALFRCATHQGRDSSWGAAMRARLFAPHANCPDQLECPGCAMTLDAREFLTHAPSCTRIHGYNASTRHANIKHAWKRIMRRHLIPHQEQEPRDMRIVECPGCKQQLVEDKWRDHAKSCASWDHSAVPPAGSGPDIRMFLPGREEFSCTVVDVTCIGLENVTHSSKDLKTAFKQVEEKKRKLYGKLCADNNAQLVIAAISDSGIPSAESIELLRAIIAHSTENIHDVLKELQAAAVESNGASLYNAECRAGIPHAHRIREKTKKTLSIVAMPAVAAVAADAAPPGAAAGDAAVAAPPSTPPPPAPLCQPAPPPLRGSGWAGPAIPQYGRGTRRERDSPAPDSAVAAAAAAAVASAAASGAVSADAADEQEPEARRPDIGLGAIDFDANNRIRHGKSPIMAQDNRIWNGQPGQMHERLFRHFQNPEFSNQVMLAFLFLQKHSAGAYFDAGNFHRACGPLATVPRESRSDHAVVTATLRSEMIPLRTLARQYHITDECGTFRPLTATCPALLQFYGQNIIHAHFNSNRSIDGSGNNGGAHPNRSEQALRSDTAVAATT